jgi:hypothetical protein
MDDLISRQAAIDRINKQREHLRPDTDERDYIGDAAYRVCAEFIGRLPSAQPEIIRCKDCKHWDGVDACDVIDAPMCDNDFCSMAERRE